jgi:hypothetical protein
MERRLVLEFTVSRSGDVVDPQIVESDATERMERETLASLRQALYRPRFKNGEPVDTPNVRYQQTFKDLKNRAVPLPSAAGERVAQLRGFAGFAAGCASWRVHQLRQSPLVGHGGRQQPVDNRLFAKLDHNLAPHHAWQAPQPAPAASRRLPTGGHDP